MDLELKSYYALPCEMEIFTINGQEAEVSDFGFTSRYSTADNDEAMERWGCPHRVWRRNIDTCEMALHKYNITYSDWNLICDKLECMLTFDNCGWCI